MRRQGRSRALSLNQASKGRVSARAFAAIGRCSSRPVLRFGCTVAEITTRPYDDSTIVKPLTLYTCALAGPEAGALEAYLREHGYEFRAVPYARFAAGKDKVNVVFYESGKLRNCSISDGATIGKIPCAQNGTISFYESGNLQSCVLSGTIQIDGKTCNQYSPITLFENGTLQSCATPPT